MPRTVIYPGSFDPITNGHVDLIRRACSLFDTVVVSALNNSRKKYAFSLKERLGLLRAVLKPFPQVEVDSFSGLLVDYLRAKKASVVLRGLRAVSDLEYEFQMASMNRSLWPRMETVFLMPEERYVYTSSTMVREIASMGGDLSAHVPAQVLHALKKKFR
ncbi:MAG: pantetheine-phosphate adenylyltransferase [Elusimicrobia bacterium RIFCSPLOWO2_12_FULL_59_9]|nr:MAG: pantetheine-phosphate adenylyltransferase [Elusimicrobia bacterium RIFCSPLOWO2_12_FULL_59_9]